MRVELIIAISKEITDHKTGGKNIKTDLLDLELARW